MSGEMSETTTEPAREVAKGSPESAAFFRTALAELGETQAGLARLMKRKGNNRQLSTIHRNIQRMALGEARVSGEMRVVLTMLLSGKRKGGKRAAEKRSARNHLPASPPSTE